MMGGGGEGEGSEGGKDDFARRSFVTAYPLYARQKSLETRAPTFDHAMWEGRKTLVVTERWKDCKMG